MKPIYFSILSILFVYSSFAQDSNVQKTEQDNENHVSFKIVKENDTERTVYIRAEIMPQFPGGNFELQRFISHNLIYPIEAMSQGQSGTVLVQFIVNEEGNVESPEVLVSSTYPALDQAAIDVVNKLPSFTPGMQMGIPVPVFYRVPMVFELSR